MPDTILNALDKCHEQKDREMIYRVVDTYPFTVFQELKSTPERLKELSWKIFQQLPKERKVKVRESFEKYLGGNHG